MSEQIRTKILAVILIIVMSGIFIGTMEVLSALYCFGKIPIPISQILSASPLLVNGNNLIVINGKAVDYRYLSDKTKYDTAVKFQRMDLSAIFPTFTLLGRLPSSKTYADSDIQKCVGNKTAVADAWLQKRLQMPGYRIDKSKLISCPLPNNSPSPCYFSAKDRAEITDASYGNIIFSSDEMEKALNIRSNNALISIHGRVYDMGAYLNIATDGSTNSLRIKNETAFLPESLTSMLIRNLGRDITDEFEALQNIKQEDYIKCFDKLFFAGITEESSYFYGCKLINPVYYSVMALLFVILLPKYLLTWHFRPPCAGIVSTKQDLFSNANLLHVIHLTNETESQIRRCINSLALSSYRDYQKLLCVVCDGEFNDRGVSLTTTDLVLKVLGHYDNYDRMEYDYVSVGEHIKNVNSANVNFGYYMVEGRRIPYIVVSKVGNNHERGIMRGSRGKRDTALIFMEMLNKITKEQSQLSPLEFEVYSAMKQLRFLPSSLEYALFVNGNVTHVEPDCPSKLVNYLEKYQQVAMVSANCKAEETVAPLQSYIAYLRNHVSPLYHDTFSSLYWINSDCFMMRLVDGQGTHCMLKTEIIQLFSNNYRVPSSMTEKQLAYQAEDAQLGYCLLSSLPDYQLGYEHRAVCHITPSKNLLRNSRILFNSDLFLTMSVLFSRNIGWNYRFAAIAGLLGMIFLPAFSLYCYYLLVKTMILQPFIFAPLLAVVSLFVPHFIAIISLLIQFRFYAFLSSLVYLIVGIPLYNILIPLISFWHLDKYTVSSLDNGRAVLHPSLSTENIGSITGGITEVNFKSLTEWNNLKPVVTKNSPILSTADTIPASHLLRKTQHENRDSMSTIRQEPLAQIPPTHSRVKHSGNTDSVYPPAAAFPSGGMASETSLITTSTDDYQGSDSDDTEVMFHQVRLNSGPNLSTISKENLRFEVRLYLQGKDLQRVTVGNVMEALRVRFGDAIDSYRDFINVCIEEYAYEHAY